MVVPVFESSDKKGSSVGGSLAQSWAAISSSSITPSLSLTSLGSYSEALLCRLGSGESSAAEDLTLEKSMPSRYLEDSARGKGPAQNNMSG
jgi:hypothetical protein